MSWVIWVLIALACGVGEMLTNGFWLAPFAVGALLAAIASALLGGVIGIVVFLVASLLTLLLVRPIVVRHLQSGPALRTGASALIGKQAIVLERIANDEGVGCVKIEGEVWTARAYDEESVIEPGKKVHVLAIKGATALVAE